MKRHVAALALIVILASAPSAAHDPAASPVGHELRGVPRWSASPAEREATVRFVRDLGSGTPSLSEPSTTGMRSASVSPAGSRETPASTHDGAIGTALIGGWAAWYEDPRHPRGLYAAAGPVLREALGKGWRGQLVEVESGSRSVTVRLSDWCACATRRGLPTLIDLSRDAFSELADPSLGIVRVSIELDPPRDPADDRMRVEDGGPTLPPTDR